MQIVPAASDPPAKVTWTAAKSTVARYEPGATATCAVLATVGPPYLHTSKRVWSVIECQVPYTSKGGGRSGIATVVGAVDTDSGAILFATLAGA